MPVQARIRSVEVLENLEESLVVDGLLTQAEADALAPAARADKVYFLTDAGSQRIVRYNNDGSASTLENSAAENFFFEDQSVAPPLLYYWSTASSSYELLDRLTYHPSLTFGLGDVRRDPSTGQAYESLIANNQGNALTAIAAWKKVSDSPSLNDAYNWSLDSAISPYTSSRGIKGRQADSHSAVLGFENGRYRVRCEIRSNPAVTQAIGVQVRTEAVVTPFVTFNPLTFETGLTADGGTSLIENFRLYGSGNATYSDRLWFEFEVDIPANPSFPLQLSIGGGVATFADLNAIAVSPSETVDLLDVEVELVTAATIDVSPWQSIAITDSPATLTHDTRATVDLTGSTLAAPLALNIEMPPLTNGQVGEIELSDRAAADTWSTGYLRLVFTDGAGGAVPVTVPTDQTLTRQVDGIININLQDIGSESLVLRYLPNAEADVRVGVSGGGTTAAGNNLVFPVGDFTALPFNDSGEGTDGNIYFLPSVDALKITFPNKADLNPLAGLWRVRLAANWAQIVAQTTPPDFIGDSSGVDFGLGLPSSGTEAVDFIFDTAGDRWIALTGA